MIHPKDFSDFPSLYKIYSPTSGSLALYLYPSYGTLLPCISVFFIRIQFMPMSLQVFWTYCLCFTHFVAFKEHSTKPGTRKHSCKYFLILIYRDNENKGILIEGLFYTSTCTHKSFYTCYFIYPQNIPSRESYYYLHFII